MGLNEAMSDMKLVHCEDLQYHNTTDSSIHALVTHNTTAHYIQEEQRTGSQTLDSDRFQNT